MSILRIYDENGKHIGSEERGLVHKLGLWHKTVHCWFLLNDETILFSLRGASLKDNPSKLYTTVSGHIDADDTPEETVIREVREEIGYHALDKYDDMLGEGLIFKEVTKYEGSFSLPSGDIFNDKVFVNHYRYIIPREKLSQINLLSDEVDYIVLIPRGELQSLANAEVESIECEKLGKDKTITPITIRPEDFLVVDGETFQNKYDIIWEDKI